jgi:hypothetical protein
MSPINGRKIWIGVAALAIVGVSAIAYMSWPTPQLGGDERVMSEVDALFTAVTARDETLLSACQARLDTLKAESKLPESAAGRLKSIIEQARGGSWETAAKRLYVFIEAQRI